MEAVKNFVDSVAGLLAWIDGNCEHGLLDLSPGAENNNS